MADETREGRNWAVAVVHGIGDTKQLAMLAQVTEAVQRQRASLVLEEEVRVDVKRKDATTAAVEKSEAGQGFLAGIRRFFRPDDTPPDEEPPRHVRLGRFGEPTPAKQAPPPTQVRFALAFWSDIASFGDSLIKLIGSLALGGMGVRYFADCGTSTSAKSTLSRVLSWMLHGLLMAKICLLALGFLPLVLCTFIFSLFAFIGFFLFRVSTVANTLHYQAAFIAVGSVATIAVIFLTARRMLWYTRKERTLALPIFWALLIYGTIMGLIILLDHPMTLGPVLGWHISSWLTALMEWWGRSSENPHWIDRIGLLDETGIYIGFMQLMQYLCGFVVIMLTTLVLLVLVFVGVFHIGTPAERRSMRLAAVGVTTMWLLMLLVLWPENVVTANVLNLYIPAKRALPTSVHWHLDLLHIRRVKLESINDLKELMPLVWFDVAFLIQLICVIGIAMLLIVPFRNAWSRSYLGASAAELDAFRPPFTRKPEPMWAPRLILSKPYQWAVLSFMVAISLMALVHLSKNGKRFSLALSDAPYLRGIGELPHELFMSMANVTLFVIASVFLFLLGAHSIRQGVKLALDVVNHFAAPSGMFPLRRKIRQRLIDTLEFLLRKKDKPHLVVISHSQGTVMTLDALFGHYRYEYTGSWPFRRRTTVREKGLWETRLKNEVASLTILTFGSPITHLYQHYFSTLYPPLAELESITAIAAERASGRIRWFNSYRIDDYIGTYIDASVERFPVNVPMPVFVDPKSGKADTWRAHTEYWQDDVFARLFAEPGMEDVLVEVGDQRADELFARWGLGTPQPVKSA